MDVCDNYGQIVSGWLHPARTGNYTFWINGDDFCELYLSNDEAPENKRLIAEVPGWTFPAEWEKYQDQQSNSIFLQAGEKYYIEALHKEEGGGDHVIVGWEYENRGRQVIDGKYLSVYDRSLLSLSGSEQYDWRVYPNPSNGRISVMEPKEATYVIRDMSGKLLQSRSIPAGVHEWHLKGLSEGIYLLERHSGSHKSQEIIVVR
jgi:hypothetical protein